MTEQRNALADSIAARWKDEAADTHPRRTPPPSSRAAWTGRRGVAWSVYVRRAGWAERRTGPTRGDGLRGVLNPGGSIRPRCVETCCKVRLEDRTYKLGPVPNAVSRSDELRLSTNYAERVFFWASQDAGPAPQATTRIDQWMQRDRFGEPRRLIGKKRGSPGS